MSRQATGNGRVSAPVKLSKAKGPTSLAKPKPATAPVAASSGRQTRPTSSVRAPPRASKPTANVQSAARAAATRPAASQPVVGPRPPQRRLVIRPAPPARRLLSATSTPDSLAWAEWEKVRSEQAGQVQAPARAPVLKAQPANGCESQVSGSGETEKKSPRTRAAKAVRFVGAAENDFHCVPPRKQGGCWLETTASWRPSEEQLATFKSEDSKRVKELLEKSS
ncbi:hypothetical protein HC762_00420 [bacterium]|nr:hypothetical protein [bacterium]